MSFGYSIGDFIAGANLSYQLIRALSGSQGASVEYQDALIELGCLQQTFLQVGRMTSNPNLTPATINAASHIVLSSIGLIGDFLEKTKRYRERLCGNNSANTLSDSWQKMGWVLFKKEELKTLKDTLHVKLSNISLLLATAKFHERMPSQVAQYHDTSTLNTPPPPSYTHLAEEQPEWLPTKIAPKTTSISNVAPEDGKGPEESKSLEFEARVARLEEMIAEQRLTRMALDQQPKSDVYETNEDGEQSIQTVQANAEEIKIGDRPQDPEAEAEPMAVPDPTTPEEETGLFTRFEEFIQFQRRKEVHDSDLISDLEKVLQRHAISNKTYKPIRFRDAVGRKFSFPFHVAQTWAGMEELIKQAFLHVEVIGPHVQEGHYDLVGPNAEIIMPQVWETMVQPDWAITMHMWPLPELGQNAPQGPPPPPPPPPLSQAYHSDTFSLSPPPSERNVKHTSWTRKLNRMFKRSSKNESSDASSTYSRSIYSV